MVFSSGLPYRWRYIAYTCHLSTQVGESTPLSIHVCTGSCCHVKSKMGKDRQGGWPQHGPFRKWRLPSPSPLSLTGCSNRPTTCPLSFHNWVSICHLLAKHGRGVTATPLYHLKARQLGRTAAQVSSSQVCTYNGLPSQYCEYVEGARTGWEAGGLPKMAGISC